MGNEESVRIVAVKAYVEYYQLYDGGKSIVLQNENKEIVQNIVQWISLLEREDVVFGEQDAVCDENNTECEGENEGHMDWKKGLLFPQKTPVWTDQMDGVIDGFNSVFGFVGGTVGSGVSAVWSMISSLFQMIFIVILFMFLLPMLRMAR